MCHQVINVFFHRDTSGMEAGYLRDEDEATCIDIPLGSSSQKYLKARPSWPDLGTDRSNSTFKLRIKGHHLVCDSPNVQAYMKVTAAWGTPSFEGKYKSCPYFKQNLNSGDTGWHVCWYVCSPGLYYNEATYIFIRNVDIPDTKLCEVQYNQFT